MSETYKFTLTNIYNSQYFASCYKEISMWLKWDAFPQKEYNFDMEMIIDNS